MYGAVLGDIIGSPYEFDRGGKTKDFPLFVPQSRFTDDTVMTIAVAEALLDGPAAEAGMKAQLVQSMQKWGRRHPRAGYGGRFRHWLKSPNPQPYNSWGNGSAMRVSAVGWLFEDLQMTRAMARLSAAVTHNHPEGIKGAKATAAAIFLAKTGSSKAEIAQYIRDRFYPLEKSLDEIRPAYSFDGTCQGTVPEALTAFLESTSFEDAIRNAISLGGDSDTIGAITGSVAYAYYRRAGEDLFAYRKKAEEYLPEEFIEVIAEFERVCGSR